ncbi:MAG: hypothetical protein R2761_25460 [Acidimicrobiales bacterium]
MSRHLSSWRPFRAAGLALALSLTLAACGGGGPGSQEDLVNSLTREGGFEQAQAECIAANVFDKYGADENALKQISGTGDYAALTGEGGVDGFGEFFDNTIKACTGT